jgi:hypothetical protein
MSVYLFMVCASNLNGDGSQTDVPKSKHPVEASDQEICDSGRLLHQSPNFS